MLTSCTNPFLLPSNKLVAPCEVTQAQSSDLNSDWLFRIDPEDIGISQRWYSAKTLENEWFNLEPGTHWEASGVEYDGVAWYRTKITVPKWPDVFLGFGRIDDAAMLWINGNPAGSWENLGEQAALVDILQYSKSGEDIQLAWRISDQGGYGGIKQPVRIGPNPRTVMTGAQYVEWMAKQHPEWPMPAWAKGVILMSHQRIRTANTRDGFLTPDLDFESSQAVVAGDQVFLVGCTGLTLDGKGFIGEGDPAKQAQAAMGNVRELLADAGATIADVCKITTYITDPSYREGIYRVLAEHFRDVHPVSTGTIVKALARPELDFEIDVFAMVPDDKSKGHDRFRLGDSNYLPELDYRLSKVVRAGNFLFLQGQFRK